MENASKALVIAGAILISILIIGLGVFIFNQASSTVSQANLNSQEAQAQNKQFETFFGEKKSAADVKQLCSLIRSNNITSESEEDQKGILIVLGTTTGPQAVSAAVKSSNRYRITVENDNATENGYDDQGDTASYYKTGYIRRIVVSENNQ